MKYGLNGVGKPQAEQPYAYGSPNSTQAARGFRGYSPQHDLPVRTLHLTEQTLMDKLFYAFDLFHKSRTEDKSSHGGLGSSVLKRHLSEALLQAGLAERKTETVPFLRGASFPYQTVRLLFEPDAIVAFVLQATDPANPKVTYDGSIPLKESLGYLISGLVDLSEASEFNFHLMGVGPWNLGYHNKKKLTLYGQVGNYLGTENEGRIEVFDGDVCIAGKENYGTIIIHGNVSDVGDEMKAGLIEVDGNARTVGSHMNGGRISIGGSVNGDIGYCMSWSTHTYQDHEGGEEDIRPRIDVNGNVDGRIGFNSGIGIVFVDGNYTGYEDTSWAIVYSNNRTRRTGPQLESLKPR